MIGTEGKTQDPGGDKQKDTGRSRRRQVVVPFAEGRVRVQEPFPRKAVNCSEEFLLTVMDGKGQGVERGENIEFKPAS